MGGSLTSTGVTEDVWQYALEIAALIVKRDLAFARGDHIGASLCEMILEKQFPGRSERLSRDVFSRAVAAIQEANDAAKKEEEQRRIAEQAAFAALYEEDLARVRCFGDRLQAAAEPFLRRRRENTRQAQAQLENGVFRDSLSAWKALSLKGGLEPAGRDGDLVEELKQRINPDASNLEEALAGTPVAEFLSAFLAAIQPFTAMFQYVLSFFERAGARYGQGQMRFSVGNKLAKLSHFQEFLESWKEIDLDIDVPALDKENAFILNDVRRDFGGKDFLISERPDFTKPITVGIPDVDYWLGAYHAGRYLPLPDSLAPAHQLPGLDDAARIIVAALHVVKMTGLTKEQMKREHEGRGYRSVASDAFHPWTVAQSETDHWLASNVEYLANLLQEPVEKQQAFAARLVEKYSIFDRRRFSTKLEARSLERILSLPAWKRRYEFYGVWVGTRIVDALDGHDVSINTDQGALRFAFAETRLADIASSRPPVSLYSERRSPLSNPKGKSRKRSAQPDYSIWTQPPAPSKCPLVVEVKHYKKESTSNFGAALIDYASAHPEAKILLVNYGPLNSDYSNYLRTYKERCVTLGQFNPYSHTACQQFRDLVRSIVGEPIFYTDGSTALATTDAVAIDVSASMSSILEGEWFWNLIDQPEYENLDFFAIDKELRAKLDRHSLRDWITANEPGSSTSLISSVADLLAAHGSVTVITDEDGAASLLGLRGEPVELVGAPIDARLLRLTKTTGVDLAISS